MVVLRGMRTVIRPPSVSTPSESGVTSSRRMSLTSPARTPPWMAAPTATTSSGLTPLCGSLPPVSSRTNCWIIGIRVAPPTRTISSRSAGVSLASASAFSKGTRQRSTRSFVNCSNLARVRRICRCFGPEASAVMKGRLISVSIIVESSIFAFSAASRSRCIAWRSWLRSMPYSFLNSSSIQWTMRSSQSSPPRWVSPLVARTSIIPSLTSRMETSKVPPPRSKTRMVSSVFLSRP